MTREYRDWIARQQHCYMCGKPGEWHDKIGERLLAPHHVKSRGAGGEDERNLVPLCYKCHNSVHMKGNPSKLMAAAELYHKLWERRNAKRQMESSGEGSSESNGW